MTVNLLNLKIMIRLEIFKSLVDLNIYVHNNIKKENIISVYACNGLIHMFYYSE